MRTNDFFIFLQVSIASLMQLKQAPVEFDQLLEVRNTIQWCNEKKKNLIKNCISTQLLAFLWSRIICMSQQVDVMIIQHQWNHKKQLRKCSQLLTKYLEAQIIPVTFQIPTDTKRWAKSLLRFKNAKIRRLFFD